MTKIETIVEVRKGGYVVRYFCDNCGLIAFDRKSHYNRKKRHFCNSRCYSIYRRDRMSPEEQNSYGRGNTPDERAKRRKARSDLNHHLRDKHIDRKPCEVCGDTISEAHHDDYDKPLDVRWLCFRHHRSHHRAIYPNPNLLKENI